MPVIDLDDLVPEDKQVRLRGKIYKLPGDIPLETFAQILRFDERLKKGEPESEMIEDVKNVVLGLFQVCQPAMKALPVGTGVAQLIGIIGAVYGGDAVPPTKTTANRQTRRAAASGKTRTPTAAQRSRSGS